MAIVAGSSDHPDNPLSAALGECSLRSLWTGVRIPAPPRSGLDPKRWTACGESEVWVWFSWRSSRELGVRQLLASSVGDYLSTAVNEKSSDEAVICGVHHHVEPRQAHDSTFETRARKHHNVRWLPWVRRRDTGETAF
jgi:hypothetical protein